MTKKERRTGELWGGGPCQGPGLYFSLMRYFGQNYVLLLMRKKQQPLYTRENLYLQKLSNDDFSPKRQKLKPRKIVPLQYRVDLALE